MTIQVATLCDSASDYNGKLCLLGAFDTLCSREFPVVHPACALVVRMIFEPVDTGRYQFTVRCTDTAGKEIMPGLPLEPAIEVTFPGNFIPFVTRNIVLNLQRIRFERAGLYTWVVASGDTVVARIPLRVTLFDESRSATGPGG